MAGTKVAGVNQMKKGSYVVLEGAACVVQDTQTSRPGKHGHAKVRIVAVGMLDGKKRDVVMPGHDNVEVPIVEKLNAQILSMSGDKANVMDMTTFETFDLNIPEDMKGEVKEGSTIVYWDILGERVMKQLKAE
ncbi:MAG: translation initiation factor IF-5A [Nanoarchaeota archaeon]|nr:translation initiation factor IF-5A [Nanoarchaeota archaeon]